MRGLLSELHLVSFVVVTEEASSLCLLTPWTLVFRLWQRLIDGTWWCHAPDTGIIPDYNAILFSCDLSRGSSDHPQTCHLGRRSRSSRFSLWPLPLHWSREPGCSGWHAHTREGRERGGGAREGLFLLLLLLNQWEYHALACHKVLLWKQDVLRLHTRRVERMSQRQQEQQQQ